MSAHEHWRDEVEATCGNFVVVDLDDGTAALPLGVLSLVFTPARTVVTRINNTGAVVIAHRVLEAIGDIQERLAARGWRVL